MGMVQFVSVNSDESVDKESTQGVWLEVSDERSLFSILISDYHDLYGTVFLLFLTILHDERCLIFDPGRTCSFSYRIP